MKETAGKRSLDTPRSHQIWRSIWPRTGRETGVLAAKPAFWPRNRGFGRELAGFAIYHPTYRYLSTGWVTKFRFPISIDIFRRPSSLSLPSPAGRGETGGRFAATDARHRRATGRRRLARGRRGGLVYRLNCQRTTIL